MWLKWQYLHLSVIYFFNATLLKVYLYFIKMFHLNIAEFREKQYENVWMYLFLLRMSNFMNLFYLFHVEIYYCCRKLSKYIFFKLLFNNFLLMRRESSIIGTVCIPIKCFIVLKMFGVMCFLCHNRKYF